MRGASAGEEVPCRQDRSPNIQPGHWRLEHGSKTLTPLEDCDPVINMVVLGSDCPGPPTYSRRQLKKFFSIIKDEIRVIGEERGEEDEEELDDGDRDGHESEK